MRLTVAGAAGTVAAGSVVAVGTAYGAVEARQSLRSAEVGSAEGCLRRRSAVEGPYPRPFDGFPAAGGSSNRVAVGVGVAETSTEFPGVHNPRHRSLAVVAGVAWVLQGSPQHRIRNCYCGAKR